jgi:nitronate monooxygenase
VRGELLRRLGIEHPIILAPMGGGPGTPELIAAVSNAGGLGSLGAAYLAPEQIAEETGRIRALTGKPFCVNLFAGGYARQPPVDPAPMLELMSEIHQAWGLPLPSLPAIEADDPFERQIEAVIETRPAVFSFTFGIPSGAVIARLKKRGIIIAGTATTAQEARLLAEAGVDVIIAQGSEAGAHRGTFASAFEAAMVPTLDLVREITALLEPMKPLPVVASGGLMDGSDIARAIAMGASGAQLGTAFLACPESGASEAYKRAILNAREDTTVITRAFSGRPARGLANEFITRMEGRPEIILPFPQQNTLTRAMRAASAKRGDSGFLSLWAGQGVARARPLPAADLMRRLVLEMDSARHAVS